jgi:cell division protein FtsB
MDAQGKGATGLRRKAIVLGSAIALAALVLGSLFGDRGMLQLLRQQRRSQALALEIEHLQQENARLAEQVRALRAEPRAVERLAREELGLVRAGETVFLLRDEPR